MVLLASDDHTTDSERARILDAAEQLFYARGLQLVGMDQVRAAAGVSLKRLYREFPSKDALIEAYLVRRDARWLTSLRAAVAKPDPADRLAAAFSWLGEWFGEPGFRGCAFTNSFGELGAESAAVAAIAAAHKGEFRAVFVGIAGDLITERGGDAHTAAPELGEQLYLLAEGAITAAAVTGDRGAAGSALAAAETLLDAAIGRPGRPSPAGAGRIPAVTRQLGSRLSALGRLGRLRRRR